LENDILALSMYTDQPCMQLYIGFFMDGKEPLKGGIAQVPHRTVCLEAQTEPNGPNRGEAILRPGETYRQTTIYVVEKK
jgi:aldose 1-epimerase